MLSNMATFVMFVVAVLSIVLVNVKDNCMFVLTKLLLTLADMD